MNCIRRLQWLCVAMPGAPILSQFRLTTYILHQFVVGMN